MEMTPQVSGETTQPGLLQVCAGAVTLLAAACLPSVWFTLLVAAPVLEEVVFRTGLQTQLLRRAAPLTANLLTAVAFAVAHLVVRPSVLSALTLIPALAVGVLFQRRRCVLQCMAVHAAFNAAWLVHFQFSA